MRSFRGSIVDPVSNREIVFESILERNLAAILRARRDVRRLEDQPESLSYIDAEGKTRQHTFDFRVTFANDVRWAIAVKPSGQVIKSGIRDVVERIRKHSLHAFADEALVLTERVITPDRAWNAMRILRALRMRNDGHCDQLRQFAAEFRGAVTVADIISGFTAPAYGYNAMWCLIYEGALRALDEGKRITDTSMLIVPRD
ncbi:TnsA endonuclease N-terminal domain-containing protein [Mesorhizobium sp. NPDC059054]|uniref:TnsA endonuclease N-terminal domain-containing protein n=1 Tax=Mesorhizobium sp. NPDC059054 TaxID=3346711 RepID=UPI0036A4076C